VQRFAKRSTLSHLQLREVETVQNSLGYVDEVDDLRVVARIDSAMSSVKGRQMTLSQDIGSGLPVGRSNEAT
jgi:hypothetical protein